MWADVPDHLWEGYCFGTPQVANRLDQGLLALTRIKAGSQSSQPSLLAIHPKFWHRPLANTWEENGPALGVQWGRETWVLKKSLRLAGEI